MSTLLVTESPGPNTRPDAQHTLNRCAERMDTQGVREASRGNSHPHRSPEPGTALANCSEAALPTAGEGHLTTPGLLPKLLSPSQTLPVHKHRLGPGGN